MINIRIYTTSDKKSWDEYVLQHPDGTLFHLTSWKEVIEQTFRHKSFYLLATNGGNIPRGESNFNKQSSDNELSAKNYEPSTKSYGLGCDSTQIVGIFPLFRIKSLFFGNYLTSIPFAETGGVLADSEKVAKNLLDRAIKLSKDNGCDYLELRNKRQFSELPCKSLYYNFRREIFEDPDQNLKAIPRKARRMVRQGEKFGLTSEIGNHLLTEFYEILARSYHKLGTPIFPLKFFKNFIKTFKNEARILLIRNKDNTPIASVLTFFYKDQVLPYYAGSLFEYRKLAPNDFMYWELMQYGCEKGYKIFDFGRSKLDTGSFNFKRHWGFEPVQLAYQYYLNRINEIPDQSPANPKYQKKIELWRKLPFSLTKIFGPPIARYLT
jgi:FemAB-related protein (PEP-CTERM system-associated)